jgi:phage-related protein
VETLNLFELFARIILDTSDYDDNLDEASRNTESFADKLKNGLSTAAKVGAAALTAAASGVAALTKSSIDQYAEYEQLVGGVDTLFKDASDTIQQYASNAYKTAGVSANTYMEQATAFSASLIQSLGGDTQAAAEYANQAIMDMSDNANKMGTDIESIQQTYQSLMRGNYAMLDNLKLGYGGTKSELERLVADAEELTGQALDPSKFSDVITAIHAVQENMGITGTTAKEAATTIEGSVGMMRAAWDNLLVGIANDNGDLGSLTYEFADTVETALSNILPRVKIILGGIGQVIADMGTIIAQTLPEMISTVLPSLISAGAQLLVGLVAGIISALPQLAASVPEIVSALYTSIVSAGPQLATAGTQLLSMFTSGIETGIPDLISRLPQIIEGILNFIAENLPSILDMGVQILTSLQDGIINSISSLVSSLPQVISAITGFIADNLPAIVNAGISVLVNLASGIVSAIPQLVAVLPQIISAIVNGIGNLMGSIVDIGENIVQGIWEGIQNMATWIKNKVTGFFSGIVDGVKGLLGIHSPSTVFADMGKNMALGLGDGWDNEYSHIRRDIENGLNFGTANVDYSSSMLGRSQSGLSNAFNNIAATMGQNFTITVQSVLDGKVIGETAYQYSRNKQRAYGT